MAESIVVPVQVGVKVNQQQLNNVNKSITDTVNKSKNFKVQDYFAPMVSSAKKFNSELGKVNVSTGKLTSAFAGLKKMAIGALSITALVKLGKEMLSLSSDLIEVQNVVDTVFGNMAEKINDFAKNALTAFGLTELQAKNYASTIGAIVKATGVGTDATLEMSEGLTKLTGDVASFYNLDHDTAFEKLRSGITGETEPLKSLGVVMTEVNLEAFRLSQGIATSYKEMNQAEKTALRYNYIMSTLSDTQGDFSKTQGSWSNQVRILTGQLQQLGAVLGGFLQNLLYPILVVINQILSLAISGVSALAKLFGFDMESIQINQGVAGGADVGDLGASAMDDLTDSTDNATAAQKKLNAEQKKSLANIHDLNVLNTDKGSSGSSGGAGGAGGVGGSGFNFDLTPYKDIETSSKNLDGIIGGLAKKFDPVIKRAKELAGIFAKGFSVGLGDTNTANIKKNIEETYETAKSIWHNTFGSDEFQISVNTITFNLGEIFGHITSIGVKIGEFITGTLNQFLSDNQVTIEFDFWNLVDAFTRLTEIAAAFSGALDTIFSAFTSDGAIGTAANVLGSLYNIFSLISFLVTNLAVDLADLFTGPIIDNAKAIKTALEGVFEALDVITGAIKSLTDFVRDKVITLYEDKIRPLIQSFRDGISKLVETFLNAWNEHIKPVLDKLAEKFADVVENHIKPMIDKVVGFIGSVVDAVKLLWEKWLQPIVNFLIQVLVPAFANAFEYIGNLVGDVVAVISDILSGLFGVLKGLIDFIVGVFTGDWEKAWNGIVSVFTSIWEGIKGVVKGVFNIIADVINNIINAVKKISFDVPDWVPLVGGKHFGLLENIPNIPHLANGMVIPPNQEFLAVLGDQSKGVNIETPLSTMLDAFRRALDDYDDGFGGGDIIIPIYINNELSSEEIIRKQDLARYRSNGK